MMRRAPSPECEKVQGPCFTAGNLCIDDRLFPALCRGQMEELPSEWYQEVFNRDGLSFSSDFQHLLGMNTCKKNAKQKVCIYSVIIQISKSLEVLKINKKI